MNIFYLVIEQIKKMRNIFLKLIPIINNIINNKEGIRFQTGISLVLRIGNRLTAFIITLLLATFWSPDELGIYSYVISVITLLSIFSQFGLPDFVMREVSKSLVLHQWSQFKGLVIWALGFSFILTFLLIGFCLLAFQYLPASFEELDKTPFYWGLILFPLLTVLTIFGGLLRGLGNVIQGILIKDTLKGLIWTVILIIFYFLKPTKRWIVNAGAEAAIITHVGAAAITLFVGFIFLISNLPKAANSVNPEYDISSWRKGMLPFSVISIMFVINSNIDVLMLGSLSTHAEIGIYKIAFQFATLVTFGLTAIRLVIAPHFSRNFAKADYLSLERSALKTTKLSFLFALPVSVFLIIFWRIIVIYLFSAEYFVSYFPLVILTIGELVSATVGPVGILLNMTKYEKDTVLVIIISLLINIILNIILIPSWGAMGAAVALTFSKVIRSGMLWIKVKQRFGFKLHPFGKVNVFGKII